jgi:hypothetical protein
MMERVGKTATARYAPHCHTTFMSFPQAACIAYITNGLPGSRAGVLKRRSRRSQQGPGACLQGKAPERSTNVFRRVEASFSSCRGTHLIALSSQVTPATDTNAHLHAHTHFHIATGPHFHARPMIGDWDGEPSPERRNNSSRRAT